MKRLCPHCFGKKVTKEMGIVDTCAYCDGNGEIEVAPSVIPVELTVNSVTNKDVLIKVKGKPGRKKKLTIV